MSQLIDSVRNLQDDQTKITSIIDKLANKVKLNFLLTKHFPYLIYRNESDFWDWINLA